MNKELRIQANKARIALDVFEISEKSNAIVDQLMPLLEGKNLIGIYMPKKDEVDVTSLMFVYDNLGIPKVRNHEEMDFFLIHSPMEVEKGTFGLLEPTSNIWIDPKDFDVIIVPIVAFDKNKNRLGHGRGYYDRYLASSDALKIGVAFECQRVEGITPLDTDIKMDYIVTEEKIY